MSAFTVAVFAVITAGCSLGLYRKYKYPELSGSRPTSRTGTIDSRRSTGSRRSVESSESRRSQRSQRRKEREKEREREDDNIYSELRVKSRPESLVSNVGNIEDDISRPDRPDRPVENNVICDKDHEVSLTHQYPNIQGIPINLVSRPDHTHPHQSLYQPNFNTPTQLRQQVSFNSFKGGGGGAYRSLERTKNTTDVSLASAESLTLSNGLEDSLRHNGRKIRFNPYDEFSD